MFMTHPILHAQKSGEQQAFEYYAEQLRQLADELGPEQADRAKACRKGAEVLESLAEPIVSWPDI